MKESISTSLLFSAVIIIIGLCAFVSVSVLSYSKTYKIKNRMIEIIEKYGEYNNGAVKDDIDTFLKDSGYPVLTENFSCPTGRGEALEGMSATDTGLEAINNIDNYKYCIYRYKTSKGYYYSVVAYVSYEIPLISDFVSVHFPVYGDTRIFENF